MQFLMKQNLLWSHSTEIRDKPLAQSANGSNTWSPFCLCPLYCPLPNYSQITSWQCELNETLLANKQMELFFCSAHWFDCDALWCSSQISFYFCRRKASRAHISHCFYSWPHTQNPGCSYPTPLAKLYHQLQVTGHVAIVFPFTAGLGSHTSHCQIWPQALAIKCPLAFTVWILKWKTLFWANHPFFQVNSSFLISDQPSLKNKLKALKKKYCSPAVYCNRTAPAGNVNNQTPCP